MAQSSQLIAPGDIIGNTENYDLGIGTYVKDGLLRACLTGKLIFENISSSGKQRANVISIYGQSAHETVIDVGYTVLVRILRINNNQAFVEIICVGDNYFPQKSQNPKGIIRREDVRLTEIDKLIMHECFRPGDIVRAIIISLGDSKQYFLSTADPTQGVVWAKSQNSGKLMTALSWKEMEDPGTKIKELRKVAKPL